MSTPIGQTALSVMEGVQPAIDSMNAHDHSGALGAPIPNGGIADGAISTTKIIDGAVTQTKVANQAIGNSQLADGSVSLSKLSPDVNLATSGGALTLTNYIGNGFKLSPSFTSLSVTVTAGRSNINEAFQQLVADTPLTLTARSANLIYAQQNAGVDYPTVGVVKAAYPVLDSTVVGQWVFNNRFNDTQILDLSPSANHLNLNGGTPLVDGWFDYSIKPDGTTGYLKSLNNTGLPSGTQAREISVLFTYYKMAVDQCIWMYGDQTVNGSGIWVTSTGILYFGGNESTNTAVTLKAGQTYLVTYWFNGTEVRIFVNGNMLWRSPNGGTSYNPNTTLNANNLQVARYSTAAYYSTSIIHYLEVRNAVRPAQAIAAMANKFLLPCRYNGFAATYPTVTDAGSHVYRFAETNAATLTDDFATLNGTAHAGSTGLANMPSEVNKSSGYARVFRNLTANDYYDCGTFTIPAEMTIISVFKPYDIGSSSNNRTLVGCSPGNRGFIFCTSAGANVGAGRLALWNNPVGYAIYTRGMVQNNCPNFGAVTVKGGMASLYLNSPIPDVTAPYANDTGYAYNLAIGAYGVANSPFFGQMEYVAIIPRALSQAEIAMYYNSFMTMYKRSIRDDVLPANSISVGYVRTNGTGVIEANDGSYVYGRRDGSSRTVRKWSGWLKMYTYMDDWYVDNPFQTTQDVRFSGIQYRCEYDNDLVTTGKITPNMTTNANLTGIRYKDATPLTIHLGNAANTTDGGSNYYLTYNDGDYGLFGFWMEVDD